LVFIGPKKEFQPLNNIVMIKGKFFIKKGFWIILILLVNLLSVFSQTITTPIILSSGGASASDKSAISWSLGDLVVNSVEGNNNSLLNGSQFDLEIITALEKVIPDIQVFPNPVAEILNIEFNEQKTGLFQIRIYDAKGVKFFQKDVQTNQENEISFDFSDTILPLGMWLLEIQSKDATHLYKLIKN
jgi:hypothetical protein